MDINLILGIVGALGTIAAIYQLGVLNETKKRKRELQYILASLNSGALQKQMAWQNQISALKDPATEEEWEIVKIHMRARDSFAELAQQVLAMEGIIDTEYSAIDRVAERGRKAIEKMEEIRKATKESKERNETDKPQ